MLSEAQKKRLLFIARTTLECLTRTGQFPEIKEDDPVLNQKRGVFVTLHKKPGRILRGCIGYIFAVKPLWKAVMEMTKAAAFEDPRFPPVSAQELQDIIIEISVLSPLKRISKIEEIKIGRHGLYIQRGFAAGLLLPQVAVERGFDVETFLTETCYKAGLSGDCWKDPSTDIYVFEAEIFEEGE